MVSEGLFEGPLGEAIEINNPLNEEFIYMRKTLVPSLLKVVTENKTNETIRIFEIANVYNKRPHDLPEEVLTFAGVIKKDKVSFYEAKGIIEQLCFDLGIKNLSFKQSEKAGNGASIYLGKEYLGEIEILDTHLIDFELNFTLLLKHVSLKKEYKPLNVEVDFYDQKPMSHAQITDCETAWGHCRSACCRDLRWSPSPDTSIPPWP